MICAVALLLLLASASALPVPAAPARRGDCEPLVAEYCILPFPSDFYREAGQVAFGATSMPLDNRGQPIDPAEWNSFDGFSPLSVLTTYFEETIEESKLPSHTDIAASLAADSTTVILHAETLERVPHWSEVDYMTENATRRALLITPATRLDDGTRYIVAIRGLETPAGAAVAPTPAFRALRDGVPASDPDLEARRAHFEEQVFSALGAAGIARDELQLAWDFTTSSRQSSLGKLIHARDDALARTPAGGPPYQILSVEDFSPEENANIARRVMVELEVPLYLTSRIPGGVWALGADGMPAHQGNFTAEMTVLIPRSVAEDPRPAPMIQYGHGLFGGQGEVNNGYLAELANEHGVILFASDWVGMATADAVALVPVLLTDLADFRQLPHRTQQGFVNKIMAQRAMMGDLGRDPALSIGGVAVADPERLYYYGNSQGGILGASLLAISPDLERGVLGVPGGPYALLLPRSIDAVGYLLPIQIRYLDPVDRIVIVGLLQQVWDAAEPAGHLGLFENPLPDEPRKRTIIQYSLHDSQVHYLGAHIMGRAVGARMFADNVKEPFEEELFGFDVATGPITEGSAIQGWYYGTPPPPIDNTPPIKDFDTHERVRRDPAAQAQMMHFFATGEIVDFCEGACVREW